MIIQARRVAIAAISCFIAVSASLFPLGAMAADGTLIVANRAGGSVSFIDLAAGVEIARIPVGSRIPHEVAVSPDGRLALTAEYGGDDNRGRHVILMDVASASVVARIDLGANSRPHSVMFLPDGRRAVATMQDSDRIALIDVQSHRVLRTYPTGGREGHMVRLSPDGKRAYVTSRGAEGTLSVIYLDEDRPATVIPTGPGAEGIDVDPVSGEIWVANRSDESISVIDPESLEEIARLDSRPYAGRIAMGPQYVRLWDVAARKVLAEVPIRDGTPQGGNFGVLIHDGMAIVADPGVGNIQTFSLDGLSGRTVLASGHEAPDGLAWSPVRVSVMSAD
jgi:DNA-binding beta-propeller fold protein YncE